MNPARPAVSVIVPTIGRPTLLRSCLESIAACDPAPAEIVVVDQSSGSDVERVTAAFSTLRARTVRSAARNVAAAHNDGIAAAASEFVAVTHDDCTVSPGWIGTARDLLQQDPEALFTGRVLAPEGAGHVPSTIDDPNPVNYRGRTECRVLYPNNMAFAREALLDFGGFDCRMTLPAEDNDLCYRWLRADHTLRYEPQLCVWHHDWRSPRQLRTLYLRYGQGQGAFYGKHLRQGDLRMLRFLAQELAWGARASLAAALRWDGRDAMPTWMMLRGMPHGFRVGWQMRGPGSVRMSR